MKITKWYLLAGGSATRWAGYQGVANKCYLEIDGETLIARTTRLMRENGITDITVVESGYGSKREAFEGIAREAQGPFGILLGDCYYTEAIIKDAVNRDVTTWMHYYCCMPNPWTGCPWEEGYIHLVPAWSWWLHKMEEFNQLVKEGKITFTKDFQIDRFLRGYSPDECRHSTIDKHDIFWCDETDDFDYPIDYDKFMLHHFPNKFGHRMDKLSVIIPHYNTPGKLRKLLENLCDQKNWEYPETEIIVVDDGSDCNIRVLLNQFGVKRIYQPNRGVANARNVGLMASTGKYIAFVDADDNVARNYLHTIYQTMRREKCEYAIFPFLKPDGTICKNRDELIGNNAVWSWAFTWECIGKERFNENLNVGEDRDWLERIITPEKHGYKAPEAIYIYDWEANQNSLSKRFNRGELPREKEKHE